MRRAMDVYWSLRGERFSERDAQAIAAIYRERVEARSTPRYIATVVCARTGLTPEHWHDKLTEIFKERKELSRA